MLTGVMAALAIAGCGNSESTQSTSGSTSVNPESTGAGESQTASEAQSQDTATSEVSEAESAGDYNVTWDDMAEIIVVYPSMSTIPSGLQDVEDAINEISEAEINTHVTLQMLEMGNYEQQVNLMISSGEQLDLMITMPSGSTSFTTMTSQNQLIDITDLLSEYASRTVETVGDYMKGTQINGRTMALTTYKSFAAGIYINMRIDVLEDLGLMEAAQSMTYFADYEAIL